MAGTGGAHGGPLRHAAERRVRWLGAVLLVAALGFGFQQWQAVQQVREFEELDLHLLASDLPIDAYLDRGFQNWLRDHVRPLTTALAVARRWPQRPRTRQITLKSPSWNELSEQ